MTAITVAFDSDGEGFTSRACPTCGKRFKIAAGQGSTRPLAFCPFCGQKGSRWETPEQIEYGKAFAARAVMKPALDQLDKSFKSLGRVGGGALKVKVTGKMPGFNVPPKPTERVDYLTERTTFQCCGETVRHDQAATPAHCVICGRAV
jgi:hypothetical protein